MSIGSCTDSLFFDYDYYRYLTREENLIEIKKTPFQVCPGQDQDQNVRQNNKEPYIK